MRKPITCVNIPAMVFRDRRLRKGDKTLFGTIYGLSHNDRNCCYASNKYLAEINDESESCVSHALARLRDCGYIYYTFDSTKANSDRRYIFVNMELLYEYEEDYHNNETKESDNDNGLVL